MIIVHAPAKLNLFLEVLRRRPNGYHTIQTIFQAVGLYDRLIIKPHPDQLILRSSSPYIPVDSKNLVIKAALQIKKALKIQCGAEIFLEKNIPIGAGLGGGSADAAAAIIGLSTLWKLELTDKQIRQHAARLGADVPFFLNGGTAQGGGVGDRIVQLEPISPQWFLLVNPGFPVPTASVYKTLSFPLTGRQKINRIKTHLTGVASRPELGEALFNRLEQVVLPRYAEIKRIKDTLSECGVHALMSGSGSTVFAPLKTRKQGEVIRKKLHRYPWKTWVVRAVADGVKLHLR